MPPRSPATAAEPAEAGCAADGTTIANVHRDFVEWHRGRPHYLLWALELDLPAVRERVAAAVRHLQHRLLPGYQRQAHVTLSLCGFPALRPAGADEFGAGLIERQLGALDALPTGPFELRIGALDSFTSAPFLAVDAEEDWCNRLHRALDLSPPPGAEPPYRAHLTIGLYAGCWPLALVRRELEAFAPGPPLAVTVSALQLMAYRSADIGGPLEHVLSYALGQRQATPGPAAARVLPFPLP